MSSTPLAFRAVTFTTVFLAAFAAALALAIPATTQERDDGETAMVRMAHLSPDTPKGDIYLDGEPVEALRGVPFGAVSPYLPLPEGAKKVEIYASGETPRTSEPALAVDVALEGGGWYTLAAVGLLKDRTLAAKLYEDDASPPPRGEAKLRVVHAVPDVGAATVSAKGVEEVEDPLFMLPDFANASDYAEVPAGTYTLELKLAGSKEPAMTVPNLVLSSEGIQTVFVIGQATDGSLGTVVATDGVASDAASTSQDEPRAPAPTPATAPAGAGSVPEQEPTPGEAPVPPAVGPAILPERPRMDYQYGGDLESGQGGPEPPGDVEEDATSGASQYVYHQDQPVYQYDYYYTEPAVPETEPSYTEPFMTPVPEPVPDQQTQTTSWSSSDAGAAPPDTSSSSNSSSSEMSSDVEVSTATTSGSSNASAGTTY